MMTKRLHTIALAALLLDKEERNEDKTKTIMLGSLMASMEGGKRLLPQPF